MDHRSRNGLRGWPLPVILREGAKHRRHHRPIYEPMPFPHIPQGDIIP
jgi:hypothetical protein